MQCKEQELSEGKDVLASQSYRKVDTCFKNRKNEASIVTLAKLRFAFT